MHWTIHIDPEVNCAFGKYYGALDLGQLKNAAEEMYYHPDYRENMNSLRDARNVTVPSDVSFGMLFHGSNNLVNEFDDKLGKCMWAIVVGDAQRYDKINQYIESGRLHDTLVERMAFRDMEKALRWLGIPEGYEIDFPEPDKTT